jgi:hypothetical protein
MLRLAARLKWWDANTFYFIVFDDDRFILDAPTIR